MEIKDHVFSYLNNNVVKNVSSYDSVACLIHSLDTRLPHTLAILKQGKLLSPLQLNKYSHNIPGSDYRKRKKISPMNEVYTRILYNNWEANLFHIDTNPVFIFDKKLLLDKSFVGINDGTISGRNSAESKSIHSRDNLGSKFNEALFKSQINLKKWLRMICLKKDVYKQYADITRKALHKYGYKNVIVKLYRPIRIPLLKQGRPSKEFGKRGRLSIRMESIRYSDIFDKPNLIPASKFNQPYQQDIDKRSFRKKFRALFFNPDDEHNKKFRILRIYESVNYYRDLSCTCPKLKCLVIVLWTLHLSVSSLS